MVSGSDNSRLKEIQLLIYLLTGRSGGREQERNKEEEKTIKDLNLCVCGCLRDRERASIQFKRFSLVFIFSYSFSLGSLVVSVSILRITRSHERLLVISQPDVLDQRRRCEFYQNNSAPSPCCSPRLRNPQIQFGFPKQQAPKKLTTKFRILEIFIAPPDFNSHDEPQKSICWS